MKRLARWIAVAAIAASLAGALVPAHAVTTINGQIALTWPVIGGNAADSGRFLATSCLQNVTTGVGEAYLNAVPMRGKTVTVTVLPAQVKLSLGKIGGLLATSCTPNGLALATSMGWTASEPGSASFVMPNNGVALILRHELVQNFNQKFRVTY